jgi:hypothetical protein
MKAPVNRHAIASATAATIVALDADARVAAGRPTDRHAPIALRLKVFLTRVKLDRSIADGSPHEVTPALALRVDQLTACRTRRRIASELRAVVEYADVNDSMPPRLSAVMIEPFAVRAGREAILGLAERLQSMAPPSARGVVLARALLTDGRSPLFNPFCERTVVEAVFDVQDALGTGSGTAQQAAA